MSEPGQSRLLHHAIAIPIAVLAAWLLLSGSSFLRETPASIPSQDTLDYPLHGYLANFDGHPFLSDALVKTLTEGSSIVLMGSSELSGIDHPSQPYNFFNKELAIPLIALGHADNQSFSMYSQLVSTGADLTNARLAILISPSWFVGNPGQRGTNLANFLEYQPSPSLYRIQKRVKEGDTLATPIAAYLSQHRDDLSAAQPVVQWLAHDGSWRARTLYFFSQPWNALIVERTSREMFEGQALRKWIPEPRRSIHAEQWAQIYAEGVAEHLAACTNNAAFVNDAYYAEHVKGRTRELTVVPFKQNREMQDLLLLLDYVKAMHGKPFFIIQPLNPFVYTNLEELTPTIERVKAELDKRDLPYLDLWVDDTAEFRPGTLTDVMHLGPLGWYRVDSAMNAFFR